MSGFNFADSYKAAGLTPGPDIIGLREKPFDKLGKQIDAQMAVDLTRLYFGLQVPRGTEWFREAFSETDPSFSLIDNEREAAVLAACLLRVAFDNGVEVAALAVLTTSADGNRKPFVFPELIEEARMALINFSINGRRTQTVNSNQIKLPAKTNVHDVADALLEAPDWPKAVSLFKQVSDESVKATKYLTIQVQPLIGQVANLREEVAMLWWHIGGWSRVLEKPFVDLEAGLAAAMAGLDLADMSQTPAGPAAASAILHRTILASRDNGSAKVSVKEVVNAFPAEELEKLKLGDELKSLSDVCPVLTGFLKAYEIGESPAWHSAYKKAALFNPSVKFELMGLAMQVYRERSLLSAMH